MHLVRISNMSRLFILCAVLKNEPRPFSEPKAGNLITWYPKNSFSVQWDDAFLSWRQISLTIGHCGRGCLSPKNWYCLNNNRYYQLILSLPIPGKARYVREQSCTHLHVRAHEGDDVPHQDPLLRQGVLLWQLQERSHRKVPSAQIKVPENQTSICQKRKRFRDQGVVEWCLILSFLLKRSCWEARYSSLIYTNINMWLVG